MVLSISNSSQTEITAGSNGIFTSKRLAPSLEFLQRWITSDESPSLMSIMEVGFTPRSLSKGQYLYVLQALIVFRLNKYIDQGLAENLG